MEENVNSEILIDCLSEILTLECLLAVQVASGRVFDKILAQTVTVEVILAQDGAWLGTHKRSS